MAECFRLAQKGKGSVSPNPLVGAVLVKENRIVAKGWHRRFGGPHAEVECLRSYKGNTRETTLYVNLEPCSHHGKTPPCADFVAEARIPTVVVAMKDPNPLVSGRGIRKLRKSGVKVISGVLRQEAEQLNRSFITYITKRRPFVHVKIAQTLDGKIALREGASTQISGSEAQRMVHTWRVEHDAILVGAGTVQADDPLLTTRLVKGRSPVVVILDGSFSIDLHARVLKTTATRRVILFVDEREATKQEKKRREITLNGVTVIPITTKDKRFNLDGVMDCLYQMNIASILVEGGSDVFTQFLKNGPVDTLSILISPQVFGEGVPAIGRPLAISGIPDFTQRLGKDILLQFTFDRKG